MKKIISFITLPVLLLCLVGCGEHIKESSLIGTWQFDAEHSVMLLAANHTFTLQLMLVPPRWVETGDSKEADSLPAVRFTQMDPRLFLRQRIMTPLSRSLPSREWFYKIGADP